VRESIEGPEAGSQLLDDAEKSLINEMCNVSLPLIVYLGCIIVFFRKLIDIMEWL